MPEIATEPRLQALVTRPRTEASGLAAALAARRIGVVVAPLLEIRYRDGVMLDLAPVQAVLCTSANGVRALARATRERRLPMFAVGETTAGRARAEGFSTVVVAGGDVDALARLAATRLRPQDGLLLHVAGSEVAGDLAGALRRQGFDVVRQTLYEACPAPALEAAAVDALRAGEVDLALFFSPRTAAIFVRLANAANVAEACARITALSISVAADAEIGGLPWHERRVAARPSQEGVLETLDQLVDELRLRPRTASGGRKERQ